MTDLRKAAEMALDALDIYREHNEENIGLADAAYEALRQALAQPEQEPVAWRNTETGEFCTGGFLRKDLAKWMPLYTAPLKREWVGLSSLDKTLLRTAYAQVRQVVTDWDGFFAAIDAKLKEKNNG